MRWGVETRPEPNEERYVTVFALFPTKVRKLYHPGREDEKLGEQVVVWLEKYHLKEKYIYIDGVLDWVGVGAYIYD